MLYDLLRIQNRDGWTPLQLAQQQNHETVVKLLQQAADDLDCILSSQPSQQSFEQILLIALETQDLSVLQKRLNAHNCNHKTAVEKWTPLMILAGLNGPIAEVIQLGANPYIKDKQGCNALHWAAQYGSVEAAKELMQHRKLLQAKDKQETFHNSLHLIEDELKQ